VQQLCAGWCVAWRWDLACERGEWSGTLAGMGGVVGWMCGIKVKDQSSKWRVERESRIR